jgi:hypothetical protein
VFYAGIFVMMASVVFFALAVILYKNNSSNSNNPNQARVNTLVYPVSVYPAESETLPMTPMTTYNSPQELPPYKTKSRKSKILPDDPTASVL